MKIQVKRWLREYELTFADKDRAVYVTVSLKKEAARSLVDRLAALLAEVEPPHKEGPK